MSKEMTESWSEQMPETDGIYLHKMDRRDDDEDAFTYHVKSGRVYSPEGAKWIVWGGLWKRVGDLPMPAAEKA